MTSTKSMYQYENELYLQGIELIAGVDEVGRGPLAGPLVVCAVIMPKDFYIEGIDDSKKLTEKTRERLFPIIKEKALAISVVFKDEKFIDKYNIYSATQKAMVEAISSLDIAPEHVLIDAMPLDIQIPHQSIIKGDANSASIAAASIIAKVTRDHYMVELAKKYPGYGFEKHKGYPTKEHIAALDRLGILPIHRRSYEPVRCRIRKKDIFD